MNDFEDKLRQVPFRPPPAEWRAQILAAAQDAPGPEETPRPFRWRDWLWPSPSAWGALAATWLLAFVLGALDPDSSIAPAVADSPAPQSKPAPARVAIDSPLIALRPGVDFDRVLDSIN